LIMNFISLLEFDEQDYWYQQDGAMAHTTISAMQMLSEFFGGHIISWNLWPPWSLDLSPLNLYLWGFFEGECVQKQPTHIRRTETKYLAVHFKCRCRNFSLGCIKHKEKSESMHHWIQWIFPTLNITLFFVFWLHCNWFFDK
jgi:hypothetical protein